MLVEDGLAATLPRTLGTALAPATLRVPATTTERGTEATSAGAASTAVWTATGLERQVFLSHSGRRRRGFSALGALLALLAGVWMTALMTGSVGFSRLPTLPSATAIVRPSGHHAPPFDHEPRVAARAERRHAFKVAYLRQAAPTKRRASGALGRLGSQIELD